ncbi:MAG: methionyl-tRNA formyltransferase [Spirochaetaceae bacterium]|nr:methionyl-tRNA formyltransferase [Spirochaetaceae bacterium]|tara:strand:- start:32926 stop:33909 length:984 start_codon:yes stop_codon:yes gene_type:complete
MKLGYMGTPEISAELLKALLEAGHKLEFVVSNPDRPKGRSGTPLPSAVSEVALENQLNLLRPEKPGEILDQVNSIPVDAVIVFAYGSILPAGFLNLGRLGIFNLHGSLLPELRGASPIQSALLQGLNRTGWSFQFVSQKMDCGDVVAEASLEILPDETADELTERMVPAGIALVLNTLKDLENLASRARKQDESRATYCRKILPEHSYIDWSRPAQEIHNQIRGMNPRPVARTELEGRLFKIYRSRILDSAELAALENEKQLMARAPGDLLSFRLDGRPALLVTTGQNQILQILSLQPQNKKQMDAASFLNGHKIQPGQRFVIPAEI